MPSELHLCAEAATLKVNVRNISTSTVSGISLTLDLPSGMEYQIGSVKGTGVSEKNVSNLQSPEFSLGDLKLTESVDLFIDLKAGCSMISFLNKGGIPRATVKAQYTGGTANHITLPFSIKQASLSIFSVSNQFVAAAKGETIYRKIVLKNSGDGHLPIAQFYQTNEQGLSVQGVSGGTISFNADTIFSRFDSTHFKSIGNKDIYWSKNEELVIYDTLLVSKCDQFKSKYTLLLECNGVTCQSIVANANVTLKNVAPVLKITPFRNNQNCFDASTDHVQGLIITNTGSDTARYSNISVFQSNGNGFYKTILSKIDTGSITIQLGANGILNKYSTNSVYLNNTTGVMACFGSATIGGFDAQFQELAPGDTIFLRWNSQTCCVSNCGVAYYSFRWQFGATYRDQCDNILTHPNTWGSGGIYTGIRMGEYMPTDVRVGDTSKFNITVTSGYLYSATARAKTTVTFVLPKGVNHSLAKADFRFERFDGSKWEPKSITKNGDTLRAYFIGIPKITFVRSELNVKVFGDCSSSSANQNSSYSISLDFIPDTSCVNTCVKHLYCYTGSVRTHCNQNCAGGMKFSAFDANRITFGLPDNDNNGLPDASGSLDKDKIRLERIMVGDTLLTKFRGRINRRGTTTTWTRMTARSSITYGRYLSVADARIKIYRAGNLLYSCPKLASTFTTSGNSRTFNFDLSTPALIRASCPLYSGFQFFANDSIELEVKYVISTNPGNFLQENTISNEFYLHTVASPSASQKYQCDTFSGKFMMVGYYFTNWGKNTLSSQGCDEVSFSQNYYLSVGNCCANYAGGNIFPYEYRSWAKPSSLLVIPPKGYDFQHANWRDWRGAGTGKTQVQTVDTIVPLNSTADTLKFSVGQYFNDSTGSFDLSDDGFQGNITLKVRPNCEAENTGVMRYGFVFERKNYFGTGYNTVFTTTQNDAIAYSKPKLKITALSTDVRSNSDTVEWQIRLENTSNVSVAANTWIGGSDNGNTKLVQVLDLDAQAALATGLDYFKVGDIAANQSRNLMVRATYQNCSRDSMDLLLAYNCRSFPDSIGNAQCPPEKILLKYEPINTRLESSITPIDSAIDLCKPIEQIVEVSNKGNSKAFELYFDLFLRSGMQLQDTAWLFLPNSTDSTAITNPVDLGQNTYRWQVSTQSGFLDSNGLESATSPKVNSFKLKYFLTTDCDFTSSIYYLARPGGVLKCGDEVNSGYSFSKPINVKGVKKPYFSDTKLSMGDLDICKYNGKGSIRFLNLGPDTTGTQDFIQLTLPKGLYLDTTYLVGSRNTPPQKPSFKQQVGEWIIPAGIQPGDSMLFEFNTYENGHELACGNTQIILNSVVTQPAFCVSESKFCDIKVSTSGDLKLDSIKKAVFVLEHMTGSAISQGSQESISLTYSIHNTGTQKDSGVMLLVKIVDDANQNSTHDVGESILETDTIFGQISQSRLQRNLTFLASPISSCRLLMTIDSTNCVCSPTSLSLPPISVKNAGRDTTVCSRIDVTIGSASNPAFKYSWSPGLNIDEPDSSLAVFNAINSGSRDATYPLILETDKTACKTKDTVFVTVHPALFLDLPEEKHICEGERVIIGELVTGGTGFRTYQWTPSDSLVSDNKVLTWANPSQTTTYTMRVRDDLLCEISDSSTVVVHPAPLANFSFRDTCEDELYYFKNLSQAKDIGFDSIHWTIGVEESQFWEPIVLMDSAYQAEAKLFIRDSFGCADSITQLLDVYHRPKPNFDFNNGCAESTITFNNRSTIGAGSFSSTWLSESTNYVSTDLQKSFTTHGKKSVWLHLTSDKGCKDSISKEVEIYEKPSITIELDSVCEGNLTSLKVLANFASSDSLVGFSWDLGDGQVGNSKQLLHKYPFDGSYGVELIALSNNLCSDTATETALVYQKPVASFSVQKACLGDSNLFVNTSIEDKFVTKSLMWSDGTGFISGSDTQKFIFNSIGLHPVSMIIETEDQCFDTASNDGLVLHREPIAVGQVGNCENERINFTYTPQYRDSISSIRWLSGSNVLGNNEILSHYFGSEGPYTLNIEVDLLNGCSSSKTIDFTLDPKPLSAFSFALPCADNQVEFASTSSTPKGTISQELWDLGDASSNTNNQFTHYYSLGTYTVELIVTNSFGCMDTSSQLVDINNVVTTDFEAKDICANDIQTIRDLTSGNSVPIQKYSFDLGDGSTMSSSSFDYAYAKGGTYTITLTIETNQGCQYTTSKSITVYDAPNPGFSMDKTRLDLVDNKLTITDNSTGGSQYEYTVSDGSSYSVASFSHEFGDTGVYIIKQKVTDDFGCFATFELSIPVYMITNILVPNAFHPNKDGINELFGPEGLGIHSYEIEIFDRWGGKVYESFASEAWDGSDYPPGIYVYRIRVVDHERRFHEFTGTIHLLR